MRFNVTRSRRNHDKARIQRSCLRTLWNPSRPLRLKALDRKVSKGGRKERQEESAITNLKWIYALAVSTIIGAERFASGKRRVNTAPPSGRFSQTIWPWWSRTTP